MAGVRGLESAEWENWEALQEKEDNLLSTGDRESYDGVRNWEESEFGWINGLGLGWVRRQ